MKRFYISLLSFLALCGAMVAEAATTYKSVNISRADGTSMLVQIEGDMSATVKNGNLEMTCSKGNIYVPMSDVRNWTFSTLPGDSDLWSGIDGVEADGSTVVLRHLGDRLVIAGVEAGRPVAVYGVDGRMYETKSGQGEVEIDLSPLTPGVYVVTYSDRSFKIAVK